MRGAALMSVLFLLIAASLLVALVFVGFFVWAVRSGQFEDTKTPPMRVLTEPDGSAKQKTEEEKRTK
jgi:cbb3-type cytochrome oxidase maturation protein